MPMTGNILLPPWGGGQIRQPNNIPFDPDAMFDANHIATEANFIKLLEHNAYDSKYIGYKVQLSNTVDYNNGLWVIADVNHDSTNTGQSNCYDLISENCFHSGAFSSNSNRWRNSISRTWLNNTFYPGFSSNFKSHILNPKYKSVSIWYTDDKIILPSFTEMNGNNPIDYSAYSEVEGILYPIFSDYTSRKKYLAGTTTYNNWWTRSRSTNDYTGTWFCTSYLDQMFYGKYTESSYCLAPLMRVS